MKLPEDSETIWSGTIADVYTTIERAGNTLYLVTWWYGSSTVRCEIVTDVAMGVTDYD